MHLGGHKIATTVTLLGIVTLFIAGCEAAPMSRNQPNYFSYMQDEPDPEVVLEMLARLGQTIIRQHDFENTKRGLDLGLSRGFSGSQAAKHLMGLAAANYAGGPGRKRRSEA